MKIDLTESATTLAAQLRKKAFTCEELLSACFDRVDALNPELNAVIWQDRECALSQARLCDAELARGTLRGPLHGLPITVKESFDLAGSPTTLGIPDCADDVKSQDSDVVARYRAAGGIVFGKTNVPLKLVEWQSFNAIYGSTSNPWDPTRTPGGSSGGSAVSVTTGMATLEAGSDIGSSIRNPAHYNGVFGLKPTWNAISMRGHLPDGWLGDIDIAVGGPITRSAEDLALAFGVLAGPSRFDASQWALALPPDHRTRLSQFRVGVMSGNAACPIDAGYTTALEAFADKLSASGASVVRDHHPKIDSEAHFTVYLKLLGAALSFGQSDEDCKKMQVPFADSAKDIQRVAGMRMSGLTLSHREWLALDNRRRQARLAFDAYFQDIDILIAPVAAGPAFPKDEAGLRGHRRIQINNHAQPEMQQLFWSGYSGVVGIPSVVGPMDQLGGLPVGYQGICGHGRDHTALAFARAVEREIVGYTPPPLIKP